MTYLIGCDFLFLDRDSYFDSVLKELYLLSRMIVSEIEFKFSFFESSFRYKFSNINSYQPPCILEMMVSFLGFGQKCLMEMYFWLPRVI